MKRYNSAMGFLVYSLLPLLLFLASNTTIFAVTYEEKSQKIISRDVILTIQNANGHMIDCIDKRKQSSVKPFLKNHIAKVWSNNERRCPKNSIPILRAIVKTINITSSLTFKKQKHSSHRVRRLGDGSDADDEGGDDDDSSGNVNIEGNKNDEHEVAGARIHLPDGIKALEVKTSLWNPFVEGIDEFSSTEIWFLAGDRDGEVDIIRIGWQVNPTLYKDNETRFFTYWTNKGSTNEIDGQFYAGGFFEHTNYVGLPVHTSVLGGQEQEITVSIKRTTVSGTEDECWSLRIENELIGYWPVRLFTHLENFITRVHLMGHVKNIRRNHGLKRHTRTQMGSGHFANEGFSYSSYFSNIRVLTKDSEKIPISQKQLITWASSKHCYSAEPFRDYDINIGAGFFFGGPGYHPTICR